MANRLLQLPRRQHLLLFGARGTGKTTLLRAHFPSGRTCWLDLTDPLIEGQFSCDPEHLETLVGALPAAVTHVVIEGIQKVPRLLAMIRALMPTCGKYFVLSASSLFHQSIDGFVPVQLSPFSYLEVGESFELSEALRWGQLPSVLRQESAEDKEEDLRAYVSIYLKEVVWGAQGVRDIGRFRTFLSVVAMYHGQVLNYRHIAREAGVDSKTAKRYFEILQTTQILFFLEPYRGSFKGRVNARSKFYFFDVGVVHVLTRALVSPLKSSMHVYAEIFEQFVLLECLKLARCFSLGYTFSYVCTQEKVEIKLVVMRPGIRPLCIDINSAADIQPHHVAAFGRVVESFGECEAVCFSNDPQIKKYDGVTVFPWRKGVKKYFSRFRSVAVTADRAGHSQVRLQSLIETD